MNAPMHTPGPWTYKRIESGLHKPSLVYCLIGPAEPLMTGRGVGYSGTYGKSLRLNTTGIRLSEAECEANARLMAAAPETVQALKGLLELIETLDAGEHDSAPELIAARTAIAKAEGRS